MEFQHITRMLFFPLMPTHKHFNAFDVRQNYLYILVIFLVYKWKFIKIIYVYGTAYDCFACRLICDLYTITLWYGNIFYLYVFFPKVIGILYFFANTNEKKTFNNFTKVFLYKYEVNCGLCSRLQKGYLYSAHGKLSLYIYSH